MVQENNLNQTIERTALTNLICNEDYARKVLPFIKSTYFDEREEQIIFEEISNFVDKYQKIPTQTSLEIEVGERKDLNETEHKKISRLLTVKIVKENLMQSQRY